MKKVLLAVALIFASPLVLSDAIQDVQINVHKAGWYPNFHPSYGGPLNCAHTCEVWVGYTMEWEKANDLEPSRHYTSVCKVTKDPNIIYQAIDDPSSHWLYGNQLDQDPICDVGFSDASGNLKAKQSKEFMCLCVR